MPGYNEEEVKNIVSTVFDALRTMTENPETKEQCDALLQNVGNQLGYGMAEGALKYAQEHQADVSSVAINTAQDVVNYFSNSTENIYSTLLSNAENIESTFSNLQRTISDFLSNPGVQDAISSIPELTDNLGEVEEGMEGISDRMQTLIYVSIAGLALTAVVAAGYGLKEYLTKKEEVQKDPLDAMEEGKPSRNINGTQVTQLDLDERQI